MDSIQVVEGQKVVVNGVECVDPQVVNYFSALPTETREDMASRALALGVVGLSAVGVAGQLEVVEREFDKLSDGFERTVAEMERQVMERVDLTFDPDQADSVSAHLCTTIAAVHKDTSAVLDGAKEAVTRLVEDSLNPDLSTSPTHKILRVMADTKADLEKAFDPKYEDSYLSRFAAGVEEYFGEDGLVSDVIDQRLEPVKSEVLRAIQDMRDTLIGQASAADARRLSPASGFDFEDEVEETLRGLARAYGDAVERVGEAAGDAGRSKRGDFVVTLKEGPRFVVEAKDYSKPITLRGTNGILAALTDSLTNRSAAFAIAVMKEPCGFPKEVGVFNDYDTDKVLCCYEPAGQLLEAAYRWARTMLLADAEADVDTQVVQDGLDEARSALREIGRIDGHAKSIEQSAGKIRQTVEFQLRKALSGIDKASSGITVELRRAS